MELADMFTKCLNVSRPDPACPAMFPPPGEIPLDPNGPSTWSWGMPIIAVCLIVAGLAIIVRSFTRSYILKVFALEDAVMLLATLGFVAFCSIVLDSTSLGFGKHQWDVTVGNVMRALHRAYAVQIIYCWAMYLAKLGVLLQLKSTFDSKTRDFMFWMCWACIVSFTCAYTANFFIWVFPCDPIRKKWDPFIPGRCDTSVKPGILSGVVNLVTDIIILILPIFAVWRLHMNWKKKVSISGIFASGLLACAASSLRLHYSIARLDSKDLTYWLSVVAVCAIPEIAALLICGAFPTFPLFFKFLRQDVCGKAGYMVTNSGKDSRDTPSKAIILSNRQAEVSPV